MASPSEKSEALGELTDELYKGIEQMLNEAHQHMLQADSLIAHLPESVLRNGTIMARSETLGHIEGARKGVTRIRQGLDKQFNRSG